MSNVSLCDGWWFSSQWSEEFLNFTAPAQAVRLPHTVAEIPQHYADPSQYEMVCGYRRELAIPEETAGKRLFLRFDAAAHITTVYVDGIPRLTNRCGYTGFRLELTELVTPGTTCRIAVQLDCTENPAVPPFGFVIDYLTYGGLYREVWLETREKSYLEDIALTTPDLHTLRLVPTVSGRKPGQSIRVRVLDGEGVLAESSFPAEAEELTLSVPDALPWDTEHPNLYTCEAVLMEDGQELDVAKIPFGFRTAEFKADGFYLNGSKLFIRGLNRHQSYPYIGYAAPERLQREDARILKNELGCNAVRTSHYPQSHYFLDECDRLGLLVFTEIPGWQHVGDESWKEQAIENTRQMVLQYRNHTSIILWGVRINESQDDDDFYRRTNALAHELDPSRQTSGVRYLEKSSLLEDVYAFNDFSHSGSNPGAKAKSKVTPDMGKALLISECNGHMFPTKPYDTWEKRQEHALRHARVQDAAASDGGHVGCFAWCMFDYPTHKDFGSGDRVCYHGVLDAFRNPKLAAALYASQGENRPVLEIGSTMDIGDYPGGKIDPVYVFTNADEVRLYKNDAYVTTLHSTQWKGLPHGPMLVDDTIGELLRSQEGFEPKKAESLRKLLLSAKGYDLTSLPMLTRLNMLRCMALYHMSLQDGIDLYGKYVGNWGGEATRWRFDGIRDGKVVCSVTRGPSSSLHLEVTPSTTALTENQSYDMASIRVRILDENNAPAPYAQLPVTFTLQGDAQLVGPATVTAEGGMCGSYIRTVGRPGTAVLEISAPGLPPAKLTFTIV